jgi:hypothetical protein
MSALSIAMIWAAPLAGLLVWQWGVWKQNHPEAEFQDWLRADPHIAGLIGAQAVLWFIPFGVWGVLAGFILYSLAKATYLEEQRTEWKQRAAPRALAIAILLSLHLVAGFMPTSEPLGAPEWGQPLLTESESSAAWPASTQHTWLLNDGTIVVVTHIRAPGTLNPWLVGEAVNGLAKASGAKEARFQESVALMDDWIGKDAFRLEAIHSGVRHDYNGQSLLYTHDEIVLDWFGTRSSGEMITVFVPTWGGEVQLLSVIKAGSGPFVGNPGAQTYALDWLEAN